LGSRHPVEKVPGIDSVTLFVVSVMLTFVYVTSAVAWLWPFVYEEFRQLPPYPLAPAR
jgi:uncharacterized membrane protein